MASQQHIEVITPNSLLRVCFVRGEPKHAIKLYYLLPLLPNEPSELVTAFCAAR